MLLASVNELTTRIKQPVLDPDSPEYAQASAFLADASALVLSETGQEWTDITVPDVVKTVVLKAAIRAFLNPSGATSRSMGPFSEQLPEGAYLTHDEQRILDRFTLSTNSTIQMAQIDHDVWRPRTIVYYSDQYGGDAIPFIDSTDFGISGNL